MTHSNQLIHETSPYLLQHAHNPVDWHPWGEAALNRARQEDKPILVSIGYAACHWCHVMERESFEDEATAELMNRHFINIKVDREERPDLDHIYMDAVQAMTGSGGWPLNVFLTPAGKPFYGGTYFPPQRAYNRASWTEILNGVHKAYTERKQEIETQAETLTDHLLQSNAFGLQKDEPGGEDQIFTARSQKELADTMLKNADTRWGGFGNAPKFPQTQCIQFLLRHHHYTKDSASLQQALLSLDKMIDGGIYDQVGGGFARYSTDTQWLVPHFEKMLYDNALLVMVMSEAYQLTGIEKYARAIRETLAFIEREMTQEEHGFYSALDADSEGEEGLFYTWQKEEVEAVLGEEAAFFCEFYGITAAGNWENKNILWVKESPEKFALQKGVAIHDMLTRLESDKKRLLDRRSKRVRPLLDDKILLGWNALMNTAYCKAYAALGEEAYRQTAISNMQFMEERMQAGDGSWWHTYKAGRGRIPAFLDDYACLLQAYIHLQEITGAGKYLLQARSVVDYLQAHFREAGSPFFYYTHAAQEDLILRKKEVYDGATPSGNAMMAINLLYLSKIFYIDAWNQQAQAMIRSLSNAVLRYPQSFGAWAVGAQGVSAGSLELAIVGQRSGDFIAPVMRKYIPNKILQSGETGLGVFPLLSGKGKKGEEVLFYLCQNYTCSDPFTDVVDFLAKM